MARILDNTLVKEMPQLAVTFVDNHDTEPGQALFSWIQEWFKPLAYSLILLRKDGLPCVFYGDFYGIPSQNIKPMGEKLEKIIKAVIILKTAFIIVLFFMLLCFGLFIL